MPKDIDPAEILSAYERSNPVPAAECMVAPDGDRPMSPAYKASFSWTDKLAEDTRNTPGLDPALADLGPSGSYSRVGRRGPRG